MVFAAWKRPVPTGARASRPVRIGVSMLIVALAAGCHGQLAYEHKFFVPGGTAGARSQTETQQVLAYYRALQAAQRGCRGGRPAAESEDAVPSEAPAADGQPAPQQSWAQPCPGAGGSHAAHGGTSNSYRRWVEDRVRPLPAPSETASSIGSDS